MDIKNNYYSIEQATNQLINSSKSKKENNDKGLSFQDILSNKAQTDSSTETDELKFSKHAGERLESRNIEMTSEQLQRLEDGTKIAGEKGINESLVLVDDMAFIVNVNNNTVITAMEKNETSEKVFTNIDGAVIM